MKKLTPILVGGLVIGGLWLLTKTAVAKPCVELEPNIYFYCIYTGLSKTVKAALGECYPVIYTLDVWDEETGDYWPPVDPEHDILEKGSRCRVMVQAPCLLCGFEPE